MRTSDCLAQKAAENKYKFTDLFFPPSCCMCGDRADSSKLPFCDECIKKFQVALTEDCPKCGYNRKDCVCENSGDVMFLFYYHGKEKKHIITSMKRSPDKRFASFFGRMLGFKVKKVKKAGFDCVTYVPRSPKNVRMYGGDQAKFIAAGVAQSLEVPAKDLLLRKTHRQTDQKLLDASQRRKNVKNTFLPSDDAYKYHRVLLIDDVTTTGATIKECAAVLREAGVKQVIGAVIARTPLF